MPTLTTDWKKRFADAQSQEDLMTAVEERGGLPLPSGGIMLVKNVRDLVAAVAWVKDSQPVVIRQALFLVPETDGFRLAVARIFAVTPHLPKTGGGTPFVTTRKSR